MAKSSINFQRTKSNSEAETNRAFFANYLLKKSDRLGDNICKNLIGESDENFFKKMASHAKRQAPSKNNSLWEAVVNLDENSTEDDIKALIGYIEKEFGIKCTRYAIHKDEGHLMNMETGEKLSSGKDFFYNPETDSYFKKYEYRKKPLKSLFSEPLEGNFKPVYNLHAHINFCSYTLDGNGYGRQHTNELYNKHKLRQLQTKTAEILRLERGEDKRISGTQRIATQEYRHAAQAIERQKKEKLTAKLAKAEIQKFIKNNENKGLPKEFFRELSGLKKEIKSIGADELGELLEQIGEKYQLMSHDLQAQKLRADTLEIQNQRLNAELSDLRNESQKTTQDMANELKTLQNASNELKTAQMKIDELEAKLNAAASENEWLQGQNQKLQAELDELQEAQDYELDEPQEVQDYEIDGIVHNTNDSSAMDEFRQFEQAKAAEQQQNNTQKPTIHHRR